MSESRYKATLNYPNGPKPRAEILKDRVAMKKPMFEDLKEAEDYASELQRETRGKKAGGTVDNFPRQAAVIRQGLEDKVKAEKEREKDRAGKGATFKKNMEEGRVDEMGNTYKKGGAVGSASKRADGIVQRGKTRGKMY